MANTKKKNNIKITSVKSNNKVLKKGVKTTVANKKPRQNVKKVEVVELEEKEKAVFTSPIVNDKKPKTNQPKKKNTTKKKTNKSKSIKPVEIKAEKQEEQVTVPVEVKEANLTPEEVIAKRKERNRRKYENKQKKYRENKEKKRLVVEEKVEEQQETIERKVEIKEEYSTVVLDSEDDLIKKAVVPKEIQSEEKEKELERKEKRKTNRKTSGFTQTITNIKEVSVNKINDVREKVDDNTIPLGKTFNEKSKRSKRLIKEAIVYAIILTIIDVICIIVFDYFNFLRLFDVKSMNVMLTIIIALVFNFFVAFMVDYFVTNVWLTKKRKGNDGEQNGDNRSFKEKYRNNIKNKEGK